MTHERALIAGRYRLLGKVGKVGSGSMGAVWRAKDERLDRIVAIKQLFHDSPTDPGASDRTRARAIREARAAARLRHPYAIVVHDVFEQDSTPYLVMEYLPSRTLTDVLVHRGALAPDYVAELGGQLASALAAAHAEGILHRNISPNNVLITADGTARIADFGVAHTRGRGTMTGRGLVVGTPAYLAHEVADGATGPTAFSGWTVSWTTPAGMSIDDLWDSRLVDSGATTAMADAEWNSALKPGESTTFGFVALSRGGNRGIPVTGCSPTE